MSGRRVSRSSLAPVFALILASFVEPAHAGTVTSLDDAGAGTLRQVIADAVGGETITFGVTGTITLTSGRLVVDKDLTITGPGSADLTISGNGQSRIFLIDGAVTISGMTLIGGAGGLVTISAIDACIGGAILSRSGSLDVSDLVVSGNHANLAGEPCGGLVLGGGIGTASSAPLTVTTSHFETNVADDGGGIFSNGPLTVDDSSFTGNSGGGATAIASVTATRSTFSGNDVGIVMGDSAPLVIDTSTVSSNLGDGVHLAIAGSSVQITSATIASNGGNGINEVAGAVLVTIANTIIANNTGSDCVLASGSSLGFNLDSDDTCGFGEATDQAGVDPLLGALGDNGGPTLTHALLFGSPAVDAGSCAAGTDQRGFARPLDTAPPNADNGCDIGAFESTPICGDGVLQGGEPCDDGAANGTITSCCTVSCTLEPPATVCDDGDVCTVGDDCTTGTCAGTPLPDGDSDGVCDDFDNCVAEANPDQLNTDCPPQAGCDDGGDVCDTCPGDETNGCDPTRSAAASIPPSGGTVATPDGRVTIVIPPGALTTERTITIVGGGEGFTLQSTQGAEQVALEVDLAPSGLTLADPPGVLVTMTWPDADDDGDVDGISPALDERRLRMLHDGVSLTGAETCLQLSPPDGTPPDCDRDANFFTAQASSFSQFALAAPDPLGRACQRTIVKAGAKLARARAKALAKCEHKRLKGKLVAAACATESKTAAKIAAAESKAAVTIGKGCGGADKTCGGDPTNEPSREAVGWPASCPNFESSVVPACSDPIDDCTDIAACITCVQTSAIAQAMGLYFGDLEPAAPGTTVNKCQQAIGKAADKFLSTKTKALRKCWDQRLKAKHEDACPDALAAEGASARKAADAIAKAESKMIVKICKRCGGDGKACQTPIGPVSGDGLDDDLAPGAIYTSFTCPAVQVPGGEDCGAIAPIGGLGDVARCVGCVTQFKVDCMDRLGVPEFATYPLECNP